LRCTYGNPRIMDSRVNTKPTLILRMTSVINLGSWVQAPSFAESCPGIEKIQFRTYELKVQGILYLIASSRFLLIEIHGRHLL
jgi:hypothetical protein